MEVLDLDTFISGYKEYHMKYKKPCDMNVCWNIIKEHCKTSTKPKKLIRDDDYERDDFDDERDDDYERDDCDSKPQPDDVYQ